MCYTGRCKYENYFGECSGNWNEPDSLCSRRKEYYKAIEDLRKGYLTKEEIQTLIDDEVLDYDDLKFYGYDLDELDDDEDNDEVEQ